MPVKSNRTRYTAVCASIKERENVSTNVCPWRLRVPLFLKFRVDTLRLNQIKESIMHHTFTDVQLPQSNLIFYVQCNSG